MKPLYVYVLLALVAPLAHAQITLPVTFEEEVDYELTDFGGAASELAADPTDPENTVARTVKPAGAECWAGTTVAARSGFSERIPFAPGATTMSVRVWSPEAGTRVLFKVEEVGVPTVNVETYATTTVGGAWETLVFDFGDPKPNLNPIAFGANYNMASIFFGFTCGFDDGGPPAERTYYWDDVSFGAGSVSTDQGGNGPSALTLSQNYPNPAGSTTAIRFSLPQTDRVALHVYNALGQRVATLVDAVVEAGPHLVSLDTSGLASGTYLYRLQAGEGHLTRTMVITR
jgi:hypothetical protein